MSCYSFWGAEENNHGPADLAGNRRRVRAAGVRAAVDSDHRSDRGRAGDEAVFLPQAPDDNPIAFHGEAGYQADLLMPGWHFKFWVIYAVEKHPWVQVRAGEIGVVVAQVGRPLPSARSRPSRSAP